MIKIKTQTIAIETDGMSVEDSLKVIDRVYELENQHKAALPVDETVDLDLSEYVKHEIPAVINNEVTIRPNVVDRKRIPNLREEEYDTLTSRTPFRCPNCGQALYMAMDDMTIVYNAEYDTMAAMLMNYKPISFGEEGFTHEQYFNTLQNVRQETVGLSLQEKDMNCSCPLCNAETQMKEWLACGFNPDDFGFKSCAFCGDGDYEDVTTEAPTPAVVKKCESCGFIGHRTLIQEV